MSIEEALKLVISGGAIVPSSRYIKKQKREEVDSKNALSTDYSDKKKIAASPEKVDGL